MNFTYDVIVIGMGGMGSAACYHLAKRGVKVLGLEQFKIGHDRGSSHGETRIIRRAYFEHADYIPLLNRAYQLWNELEQESSQKLFVKNGQVVFACSETSRVYKGIVESSKQYHIPIEKLTREEAIKRFPMYTPPENYSALYESGAGFLYVEKAVTTHVQLAKNLGAEIHEQETVLDYSVEPDEVSVKTNQGVYRGSKLIVVGGSWNTQLLKDIGLPLTLYRVIQYWFPASTEHDMGRGTPCFAFHLGSELLYGFPRIDQTTVKMAAHFSKQKIHKPSEKDIACVPNEDLVRMGSYIQQVLPNVTPKLHRFVPCIYTMTPDENFIIDIHPQYPNVAFAGGFSGHGFKFSSVVGEILADLSLTGTTKHPIKFLRIRSF